ncbi:MAG TPA: hypothetical protein VGA30_01210 [Actinomycetota bacterium]
MGEPEEPGTKCAECGTSIECCEFCEESTCQAAICFDCVTVALGQSVAQPHIHGG